MNRTTVTVSVVLALAWTFLCTWLSNGGLS